MRQDGRCMAKMIAWVWLLSASITLPPLFGWAKNVNDGRVCLISQDRGYTVYSTAVAFYIPVSVMLFTYSRIYRAAKISAAKHAVAAFPLRDDHASADSASVKDAEEDEDDEEVRNASHVPRPSAKTLKASAHTAGQFRLAWRVSGNARWPPPTMARSFWESSLCRVKFLVTDHK